MNTTDVTFTLPGGPSDLRTPQGVKAANEAFEQFVASKPTAESFAAGLRTFIFAIDLMPECDPVSLGMLWLEHNLETFAGLMDGQDVAAFLRSCFGSEFIGHVLYMPELLQLIPITAREQFIKDLLAEQPPSTSGWQKAVQQVCPEFSLSAYLATRLIEASPDSPLIKNFVRTGHGSVTHVDTTLTGEHCSPLTVNDTGRAIWHQLTREQFVTVVARIISDAPELMFEPDSAEKPCFRQRVEAMLTDYRQPLEERTEGANLFAAMLAHAAEQLPNLKHVSYDGFKLLNTETQIMLLKKVAREEVTCSILLIAELAIDKKNYQVFFLPFLNACIRTVLERPEHEWLEPRVEHTVSIAEYLELRKLFDRIRDRDNAAGTLGRHKAIMDSIDQVYRATLEREKNVHFGTLVKVTYPTKDRQGNRITGTRLVVEVRPSGWANYIYQFTQEKYAPNRPLLREGDLVAFDRLSPNNTHLYTSRVKSVTLTTMTLVERPAPAKS